MNYFPVSWNLQGKQVVVVGGGDMAGRRARSLVDCGARVTVIDPDPSELILSLAGSGLIRLEQRLYRSGDLDLSRAVLTATEDPDVNTAVWREAVKKEIPVHVADDPQKCDFILPALVRSGDLTVAVSTNGKSPALAARIRSRIGAMFGPEYGRFLEILANVRTRLLDRALDAETKKHLLYEIIDSDVLNLIRRSENDAVAKRVEEILRRPTDQSAPETAPEGIVYIVGAGPGDPGLITARGLECLRAADVVLHDRLIDGRLLDEVRADADIIDVGKRPGDHGKMQAFIQNTMVERARNGQSVCRLKGGDPFVFGRGGEEARALTEAMVPFQIVPGITSAIAVPGAVGIPVTHRDIAHSFMVMTGSRAEEASPEEWNGVASVVEGGGTIVVMMGLRWLSVIVERLREAGCPERTPAAVVSDGTGADQEVAVGSLVDILGRSSHMRSPAVIVFGRAVTERRRLAELSAGLGSSRPISPE